MTSLAEKTARDLSKTSNIPLILINIADLQDPSIDKKLRRYFILQILVYYSMDYWKLRKAITKNKNKFMI